MWLCGAAGFSKPSVMGWPQPTASQKRRQNHGDQLGGAGPARHWRSCSFHTWCKSLIMWAKKGNVHGNARIETVICGFPQWPDHKTVNVRNLKIPAQGTMMSVPVFLDSLLCPVILFFASIKAEWCSRVSGDHFEWEMYKTVQKQLLVLKWLESPSARFHRFIPRPPAWEDCFPSLFTLCVFSCTVVSDSFCNPMDCSPPGFSVHGILQARKLECVAITYSRGSSWTKDQTWVSCVSCTGKQILYH